MFFSNTYQLWPLVNVKALLVHQTLVGPFEQFYFVLFSVGEFRIISHYEAAVFTARRDEMLSIVEVTFRYLADRPQVHSEVSGLPFMVSLSGDHDYRMSQANSLSWGCFSKSCICLLQRALYQDMPHRDFFSCLRESNSEFISGSGWYYSHRSPVNMPPGVIVLPFWS